MMKKSMILLVAALCAVSCVFSFSPEVDGTYGTLVIEGDILVGDMTKVTLSRTAPINNPNKKMDSFEAKVWVEDESGNQYYGEQVSDSVQDGESTVSSQKYEIDTQTLSKDKKYRLCVSDLTNARDYCSEFNSVCKAPSIDGLSYICREERDVLNIAISAHAEEGSYFRWTYVEDWEFHTFYRSTLKYEPPVPSTNWWQPTGSGKVLEMVYPENTYYCWRHNESSEIMIFSTENQSDDKIEELEFLSIDREDRRISYIYHIDVYLEPITKDAYLYWDNIRKNSEYKGDLFTPNPSEMIGNIRCVQNSSEVVIGYINVASCAHKDMYVLDSEADFWKDPDIHINDSFELKQSQWYDYYSQGFLPYTNQIPGDMSTTYWSYNRCVDCRALGGTKDRPDFWINKD